MDKTQLYTAYKKLTSSLRTHSPTIKGWKKIFHASGNQKRAGVAAYFYQTKYTISQNQKMKKIIT